MLIYIAIFVILLVLIFIFIKNKKRKPNKEGFRIARKNKIKKNIMKQYEDIPEEKINSILIKTQFDRNYRDVLNAFNIIAPSQKSIFNQDDLKEEYIKVDHKELKIIINNFIESMNRIIMDDISDNRTNLTGWDSRLPNKKIQSGWEKQMERLGLPQNLYNDPVHKNPIRLISINNPTRVETEKEIKYVCHLILQKNNIDEQIFIKINLIINKNKNGDDNDVIIEQIFIIGFLINDNPNALNNTFDDFYNFSGLNNNNLEHGVTSENKQLKMLGELERKYNTRLDESYKFSENISKNKYDASTC